MANVIKKATNKFTKGLVMDFSPENTQNEVLTHALNATLLTFNGNELSLQNDMGNARVETAFLPEGYIPVGTCEYGGIIYIVSYNPLEDKSLIGCFPSPERNISRDELGTSQVAQLTSAQFLESEDGNLTGNLLGVSQKVLLKDSNLNPGDKFIIYSDDSLYKNQLQDLEKWNNSENAWEFVKNPLVKLSVVSIEDSGKIVYLNSDVIKYEVNKGNLGKFNYHILGQTVTDGKSDYDVDSYRNVLSSGYNVFKEKTSGKLAILAELVTIDTFSATHSIVKNTSNSSAEYDAFDVILHTEVTPEVTSENYNTVPKLKYYYLKNTHGYLECSVDNALTIVDLAETSDFRNIFLFKHTDEDRYEDWGHRYIFLKLGLDDDTSSLNTLDWSFPYNNYHASSNFSYTTDINDFDGYEIIKDGYYLMSHKMWSECVGHPANVWSVELNQETNEYVFDSTKPFVTSEPVDKLVLLKPHYSRNVRRKSEKLDPKSCYIVGITSRNRIPILDRSTNKYITENPINLLKEDFLVEENDGKYTYKDVLLASFKLPKVITDNNINFPFKYDYTLVPCMEYGKLDYLGVLNVVDLNNLHNFEKSKFNTWKYRIDGDLLMLTFGAEIYDTFETDKVDGLILEFYDLRGFAGSLELSSKKSYSGKFTKVLNLNQTNALSKNKIKITESKDEDGKVTKSYEVTSSYNKNINITKDGSTFKLNGKTVEHVNDIEGWKYVTGEGDSKTYSLIESDNNDCGVLYSNVIYGVRPYLRVATSSGSKYIPKDDMFLFTFPIYNDYYYSINDFNSLRNPKIGLALTYKLEDSGNINPYNNSTYFVDGYGADDKLKIDSYLSAQYLESSFDVTRYYKYHGQSDLSLEVGLLQEYENYNLTCDKSINNVFSCTVELVGDGDNSFYTVKGESSDAGVLNHKNNNFSSSIHNIGINSVNNRVYSIQNSDFVNYNFITSNNRKKLPIKYSFIIGYDVKINDIKDSDVPATTVCALFHKKDDDSYNYSDFGLRQHFDQEENALYVLNEVMTYSNGSHALEEFGLCRMTDPNGGNMTQQCLSYVSLIQDAEDELVRGKLHSGEPLRKVTEYIGKLLFMQPHALGLSTSTKVNVTYKSVESSGTTENHLVVSEISEEKESYFKTDLLTHPIYLFNANVLDSINWYSKFVVSRYYDWNPNMSNVLIGPSARELERFNKKLINTMKWVYAYNPDYDYFKAKVGDVIVDDTIIQFNSSIISYNASLNNNSFNNHLKIGPILVCDYLNDLELVSGITEDARIQFQADLTYCGVSRDNPYLISNLTYNVLVPESIYSDLQMNLSGKTVVRHSDGTFDVINATPDNKTLYGWYEGKKLYNLDVSNYKIHKNGNLEYVTAISDSPSSGTLNIPCSSDDNRRAWEKREDMLGSIVYNNGFVEDLTVRFKLSGWISTHRINDTNITHILEFPYSRVVFVKVKNPGDGICLSSIVFPLAIVEGGKTKAILTHKPVYNIKGFILKNAFITEDEYNQAKNVTGFDTTKSYVIIDKTDKYSWNLGDMFSNLSTGLPRYLLDLNGDTFSTPTIKLLYGVNDLTSTYNLNDYVEMSDLPLNNGTIMVDPAYRVTLRNEVDDYCVLALFVNIDNLITEVNRFFTLQDDPRPIVTFEKTVNYTRPIDETNKDYQLVGNYYQLAFCGTNVVINDLIYSPEKEGHRLFIRDIFTNEKILKMYLRGSTYSSSNMNKNVLHLQQGPSFTNLYLDSLT